MASISDLNDDCLVEVLECLPSRLLFTCISSPHLKNAQFRRCALDVLKKIFSPFSLKSQFTATERDVTRFMRLEDSKRRKLCELRPPYCNFAASSLADFVESAEIPVYYNYAGGDLDARLDLVKALPNIKFLAIRVLVQKESRLSFGSSFSKVAAKLGPLFPNLVSFAVVGPVILPDQGVNAVIEMINQMPQVVSLKLPSYLLRPVLTRIPAKANELNELILYRNHNDKGGISCATVISEVGGADLAELSHLKYSCRSQHDAACFSYSSGGGGHNCIQAFAPLQKLPKLNALTLDIDFGLASWNTSPAQMSPDGFVSLSELNVTLREGHRNRRSEWTRSLFSQFADVRTLRVFVTEVSAEFFNIVQSAVSGNPKMSSSLQEFRFESRLLPPHRWTPPWSAPAKPEPLQAPALCHFSKLERLIVTGAKADLSGFASEERGLNSDGYPSIAEFIRGLKSCRTLKYAKMGASVDSPEALKVWLPDNCEILDVIERPREHAQGCFILHPRNYWRPLEILISVEKDAVPPMNETAKFALRVTVPQ